MCVHVVVLHPVVGMGVGVGMLLFVCFGVGFKNHLVFIVHMHRVVKPGLVTERKDHREPRPYSVVGSLSAGGGVGMCDMWLVIVMPLLAVVW